MDSPGNKNAKPSLKFNFQPGKQLEMEFPEVETQYKFFNKKICPVCGNKLVPNIKRFYQGRKITSGVMDVAKRDVYRGEQYYYCENCDKNSSLLELAQSRLKQVVSLKMLDVYYKSPATRLFDPECDNGTLYLCSTLNTLVYISDGIECDVYRYEISLKDVTSVSKWNIYGFGEGICINLKSDVSVKFAVPDRETWFSNIKRFL